MIKPERFHIDDLSRFTQCDSDGNIWAEMAVCSMDPNKDIISLLDEEDRIIAIVILQHFRKGVAELSLVRGIGINSNRIGFHKCCLKLVEFFFESMGLHRLEMSIDPDREDRKKWCESLGFSFDHSCSGYVEGKTYYIYSRLK